VGRRNQLIEEVRRRPLLQVAFDLVDLDQAIEILKEVDGYLDIAEVGTPLIKSVGMCAVKRFRDVVGDRYVLADLKALDAIEIEFEEVAKAGGDAVTVMGYAYDEIISFAVDAAKRLGLFLVADLMYVPNPVERATRLAELGVDAVCLHIGVDVQRIRGLDASQLLSEVRDIASTGMIVAVAGGIKPTEVDRYIEHGARIVIIGSGIVRSSNPRESARIAIEKMRRG